MPNTPEQWTILGMVATIAGAGVARLWVFGWTYADKVKDLIEMTEDRNFWRDTALQSMQHTDKALEIIPSAPVRGKR